MKCEYCGFKLFAINEKGVPEYICISCGLDIEYTGEIEGESNFNNYFNEDCLGDISILEYDERR